LNAPPPKSGKSWILWTILFLVLALVAYYFLYGRNSSQTAKPATSGSGSAGGGGRRGLTGPVPVTVAAATKGDIGQYLDALGTVTPVYTATITPQVGGVLTAVHYTEGQFVHKGTH